MKTSEMNPRYLCYCTAHGKSPDEMFEHDKARWPGGVMAGFICWITQQWGDWKAENNAFNLPIGEVEHKKFDQWLSGRAIKNIND